LTDVGFGVGAPGHTHALLQSGFATDSVFGGLGDQPLNGLAREEIYVTLIPESATFFNVRANKGGESYNVSVNQLEDQEILFVGRPASDPVVDQTTAPAGDTIFGRTWQKLGEFVVADAVEEERAERSVTLNVRDAIGPAGASAPALVAADALLLRRIGPNLLTRLDVLGSRAIRSTIEHLPRA